MNCHSGPLRFRAAERDDAGGIADVCYRTGYHGEDLEGSGRFDDRRLFALLFALYYPLYEPENAFVAVDENGRVAGYILGTTDSRAQARRFRRRMLPRILLRALAVSWWRYPESFRTLSHFSRVSAAHGAMDDVFERHPAHLHINLLAGHQRGGAGSVLIDLFEARVRAAGVAGIHLSTSELNIKALPFYRKHGYALERILSPGLWPDAPHARGMLFVKSLSGR
ncbi:MAG: GNAT family N-acetyltransferase [Spirochaetes bacterium]|jgi:ribosomal protein S18 acetylase RimI-like enzyme|nr:GNAT family N-acetyltransferase [Spirochaetota bacterium]